MGKIAARFAGITQRIPFARGELEFCEWRARERVRSNGPTERRAAASRVRPITKHAVVEPLQLQHLVVAGT